MGDSYAKFFRNYFADEENLNDWVEKAPAVALAKDTLGTKFISAQRFADNLELFCKANKWSLDMKRKRNSIGNAVPHFLVTTENYTEKTEDTNYDIDTPPF